MTTNDPIDPAKMLFYMEAASITDEQKEEFKQVSEILIKTGRLERLSEEGAVQAVDRLAYEITKLAVDTLVGLPGQSTDQVLEHEAVQKRIEELDDILIRIAFASGIHKAIIDVMVSEREDYWTDRFKEQLTFARK